MPVSKNDAIFCNPIQWIAKNGIVFAYGFVPFNSSNWGRGELQSLPRRAQICRSPRRAANLQSAASGNFLAR
jgi:hypothetical protein